mgnify:CR=1 FL=1
MESFVEELFSGKARNELAGAIRGRGAFRGVQKWDLIFRYRTASGTIILWKYTGTTNWNMKTRGVEVLEQICYDLHFEMRRHLLYIIKRMS